MIRTTLRTIAIAPLFLGAMAIGGMAQAATAGDGVETTNCVTDIRTQTKLTPLYPGSPSYQKATMVDLRNSCGEDRTQNYTWIRTNGDQSGSICVPANSTVRITGYDIGDGRVLFPRYQEGAEGAGSC